MSKATLFFVILLLAVYTVDLVHSSPFQDQVMDDEELRKTIFLKNRRTPATFSFIFGLFKQILQLFTTNQCEKCHVHPVYSTGIQTHDLSNMSRLS